MGETAVKNTTWKGIVLCLLLAIPSWIAGKAFPIIGGAVIAIVLGMIVAAFVKDKSGFETGIKFVSKKILQWAVILLGFGLNLNVIFKTGKQSLPIIVSTITASLVIAFVLCKVMHIPNKISILVGVGSSICGGSAVAATAPVIDADDEEVAQAISVIFFFNVLAALLFPTLGRMIGFDTTSGEAFGIFAGTAVNDTSSVTSAASTWDSMWNLGSATLDTAVTVKLTRTLAIIPITLVLALIRTKKEKNNNDGKKVSLKQIFPFFILYFILASIITTVAVSMGVNAEVFHPMKELSKFFIVLAMAAIGLNTDIVKLIKTGGKPLVMGFCCWVGITCVSLLMQHFMHLW
ncbi:MAG: YeiH family protein [Wujia sp.]